MRTPDPEPSLPIPPHLPHPREATPPPAGARPSAADLTPTALGRALKAGLGHTRPSWGETAAVDLLIAHGTWLAKPELIDHIGLDYRAPSLDDLPRVIGVVFWDDVAARIEPSPASTGEKAVLRLACHLAGRLPHDLPGGQPGDVPLQWSVAAILASLDTRNALLATRAIAAAALGPDTVGPL